MIFLVNFEIFNIMINNLKVNLLYLIFENHVLYSHAH